MKTLLALLLTTLSCMSQPVWLRWDKSPIHGSNQTYALKWFVPGAQITNKIIVGQTNFMDLTNGPWGPITLQAVAVNFGTNGTNVIQVDSDPSNPITVTNRPSAPLNLRIIERTDTVEIEGTFNGGYTWKPLAIVTNDPAIILGSMQSMMIRAKQVKPPPLP